MRPIDADALYKEFEESGWYCNADRDDIAEELLLDAPTLTLDEMRPKGEWELKEFQIAQFGVTQALVCTNCGYDHEYDEMYDYCPNCGAKMGGGK